MNLFYLIIVSLSLYEVMAKKIDADALHGSDAFCVDVSTYTDVSFSPEERRRCDTSFVKKCETKTQKICSDVTELRCDVVPFAECTLTLVNTPYITSEIAQQLFERNVCRLGTKVVQHTKMFPECRNVTKQNCITNWETDKNGKQVWAGNEACEPVEWRECRLVPRAVPFEVPDVICAKVSDVGYSDVLNVTRNQLLLNTHCTVNHTKSCKPFSSSKCMNLEYQECSDQPIVECEDDVVMIPNQEFVHRKKCLLPNVHGGAEPYSDESNVFVQIKDDNKEGDEDKNNNDNKDGNKEDIDNDEVKPSFRSQKLEEDLAIMAEYSPEQSLKADELKRWRLIREKRNNKKDKHMVKVLFSQG